MQPIFKKPLIMLTVATMLGGLGSCSSVDFSQFPGYDIFNPPEKMVIVKRRPKENLITGNAPPMAAPATPANPTYNNYDQPAVFGTKSAFMKKDYPTSSNIPSGAVPPDYRAAFNPLNPIKVEERSLYEGRYVSGDMPVTTDSPQIPPRDRSPNQVPEDLLAARQLAAQTYAYNIASRQTLLPPGELPRSAFNNSGAYVGPEAAAYPQATAAVTSPLATSNQYIPEPANPSQQMAVPYNISGPMPASSLANEAAPAYPTPQVAESPVAPAQAFPGFSNRRAPVLNPQTKTQVELLAGNNSAPYPNLSTIPPKPDYEAKRAELSGEMDDIIAERNRIAEQQRYYNDPINVIHPNKPLRPDPELIPQAQNQAGPSISQERYSPMQPQGAGNDMPGRNHSPDNSSLNPYDLNYGSVNNIQDTGEENRNRPSPSTELKAAAKPVKKSAKPAIAAKKEIETEELPAAPKEAIKEPVAIPQKQEIGAPVILGDERPVKPERPDIAVIPVAPGPSSIEDIDAPVKPEPAPKPMVKAGHSIIVPKVPEFPEEMPKPNPLGDMKPAPMVYEEKPKEFPYPPAKKEYLPPANNFPLENNAPVYNQPSDLEVRPNSSERLLPESRYSGHFGY